MKVMQSTSFLWLTTTSVLLTPPTAHTLPPVSPYPAMKGDKDGALGPLWKQGACFELASHCCRRFLCRACVSKGYHSKTGSFELGHIYIADVIYYLDGVIDWARLHLNNCLCLSQEDIQKAITQTAAKTSINPNIPKPIE